MFPTRLLKIAFNTISHDARTFHGYVNHDHDPRESLTFTLPIPVCCYRLQYYRTRKLYENIREVRKNSVIVRVAIHATNMSLVDRLCARSNLQNPHPSLKICFISEQPSVIMCARRDFSQVPNFLWGREAPCILVAVSGRGYNVLLSRPVRAAELIHRPDRMRIARGFERRTLLHEARNRTAIKRLYGTHHDTAQHWRHAAMLNVNIQRSHTSNGETRHTHARTRAVQILDLHRTVRDENVPLWENCTSCMLRSLARFYGRNSSISNK